MAILKVYKETVLPATKEAHAIYLVAPTGKPDYVEMYVTNADATVTKRIITDDDVQTKITAALSSINEIKVVADITERDALDTIKFTYAYVKDASADATVTSGGATYIYDAGTTSWVKTSEAESLDIALTWNSIQGKPTSTPAQIDAAVQNSHTHTNKSQLDKIGEDNGNLTYDGSLVKTEWTSTGW